MDSIKALEVCRLREDFSGVRLTHLPPPKPKCGEVVLQMRAAGINFPDLLMAQGRYQLKPDLPFILGLEMAGEVVAVGEAVPKSKLGLLRSAGMRFGAFAEQVSVPWAQTQAIPPGLGFAEAASWMTAYLTAYVGLVRRGQIKKGDVLLVLGAAGGVGLAAMDMGLRLGARVLAVASTRRKRMALKAYGAHEVLAPNAELGKKVKALTGGAGAQLVYDPVGGDQFDWAQRAIGWGGRYLVIGFAAGRIPSLPVNLPLIKGYSVIGVRAGEYGRRDPKTGAQNMATLRRMMRQKQLRPYVDRTFALKDWRKAFAYLAQRKVIGKACFVC